MFDQVLNSTLQDVATTGQQAALAMTSAPIVNPGATDPNTLTPQAGAAAPAPAVGQAETYADAWAAAPDGGAPVRSWIDPSLRNTPQGEYMDAWYDQGVPAEGSASGLPAHQTEVVAAPATPTPTEAPVLAAAAPVADRNWREDFMEMPGNSGDGSGGDSGDSGDSGDGGGTSA